MKFRKIKCEPSISDDEKDMFYIDLRTYNGRIKGNFEKSEIRHLIEKLDNAI